MGSFNEEVKHLKNKKNKLEVSYKDINQFFSFGLH